MRFTNRVITTSPMILNCEMIPSYLIALSCFSYLTISVLFSYAHDQDHLNRSEDIVGSVRGYIPMVGYVTIMLSEHPWLKTVLLGIMGLMVMLQRE